MASREGVRYGLPHVVRYAHARSTILLPLRIAGLGVSVRVECGSGSHAGVLVL